MSRIIRHSLSGLSGGIVNSGTIGRSLRKIDAVSNVLIGSTVKSACNVVVRSQRTVDERPSASFASRQHLLNFENQCQCSAGAIAGPKREKAPYWDTRKRDRKKAVKAAYWSVSSRRLECQPRFTVCAKREPVHAF